MKLGYNAIICFSFMVGFLAFFCYDSTGYYRSNSDSLGPHTSDRRVQDQMRFPSGTCHTVVGTKGLNRTGVPPSSLALKLARLTYKTAVE